MKKIRAILEYLAAFIIIFLLLTTIGSVIIVKFYGNDLREYTMDIINNQLDTKISVDEVGLSIFKKFPNTAVYFNNITVWSGHKFNRNEFPDASCDTLFTAEMIYLEFNALDLLRKKYTVRGMEARDGELRIFIDSSGNSNFMLDPKERSADSSKLIEVNGVELNNIEIQYWNLAKEIEARGRCKNVSLEGQFSKQNYLLKVDGNAYIEEIDNQGISYFSQKELKTDIAIKVKNKLYTIDKGALVIGDLSAGISGSFSLIKETGVDLDLTLDGKRISIEWISELLAYKNKSPEGIKGSGNINLSVNVTGLASSTLRPHIVALFSTRDAFLEIEPITLKMSQISLDGVYSNGDKNNNSTSVIKLKSFSTHIGNSKVSGSLQLNNLLSPTFNISLVGELLASEVSEQLSKHLSEFPLDLLEGKIKPNLNITGTINNLTGPTKKISIKPAGTIEIVNLSILAKQAELHFQSLNGTMNISSAKIGAAIKGYFSETDFGMDLIVNNPFSSGKPVPYLQIEGSISSSNVDIDQILADLRKDEDGEKAYVYPKNIGVNIDFFFDKITKGEIITNKVLGKFIYNYPNLYIDPIYLETMNGEINSRIALKDLHKNEHQLVLNSSFKNVDVKDLFKSFDNFGQDFLTDQNIAGNISGESEFFTTTKKDFSIEPSKIISKNSFSIENGELNNFQPMIELSDFLKIDKMDHIKFSKISNSILIKDNLITIPEMNINSSALNLQASGTHSFDKTFEYHLATKLSDILFSKANSAHKQEFEIALDTEDKRTIFLLLYDKGEGIVVDFDEDQAMKKIRQDLKEEKIELKVLLNE